MAKEFSIQRRVEPGRTVIAIAGDLTEDANFEQAASLAGDVVLDLGGITRINSLGVRQWIQFIRKISPEASVSVTKCTPVMINQVNMIANFMGKAIIVSFEAPYVCETCNASHTVLLETAAFVVGGRSAQPGPCPACGSRLILDDLEASYFAFLDNPKT